MNKRLLNKPAFAMLQPPALPGTYTWSGIDINEIVDQCVREARMIMENGFDGIILQNMNDMPIKQHSNFETVAFMTRIACSIKQAFPDLLLGILVNWDGVAALTIAEASGADFIRVEHLYTGVNVTSAGLLEAQCVDILSLKKKIGSKMPIMADIYEVHGVPIGRKTWGDAAWEAVHEAFADGLFVSGKTIEESLEIIAAIKKRVPNTPVYLGGGANGDNIGTLIQVYDGVSIATWIKDGNMRNPINPEKANYFMEIVQKNRN
ncbi:MAG: BtpA/SgcQ family protein [Eubacteriales bacterium]|nr:BtpA/SgcQ family protein [Eubacteriales bacterium]